MAKGYERLSRRNQQTGHIVKVLDLDHAPNDSPFIREDGRWVAWCDEHKHFSQHQHAYEAFCDAQSPFMFCELCADQIGRPKDSRKEQGT